MILPSLLAANTMKLGAEIQSVIDAGASGIHLDIMDNHYVPNLSFGPDIARAMRQQFPKLMIDVHLMVSPVEDCITSFASAKVNRIAIHPETAKDVEASLKHIQSLGIQSGLVLNPKTSADVVRDVSQFLDFILVMSVEPGFGNQAFMPEVLPKISSLSHQYPHIPIAVDGGLNSDNVSMLHEHGAQQFIMGSAIFKQEDYHRTIQAMFQRIGQ